MKIAALVISVSLLVTVAISGYYQFALNEVRRIKQGYPVVNLDLKGKKTGISYAQNRPNSWSDIEEISDYAIGAVLVSEDWAFFEHTGIDAQQLRLALKNTVKKGKLGRGASTITQQVAKNIFFTNERSLSRKLKELVYSFAIESMFPKWKILEIYFNIAEWGEGIYGIRSAANYYFKKSPTNLLPKESAFLAMLLPSPIRYAQSFRDRELTDFAHSSIHRVLLRMAKAKYIDLDEVPSLESELLNFESEPAPDVKNILGDTKDSMPLDPDKTKPEPKKEIVGEDVLPKPIEMIEEPSDEFEEEETAETTTDSASS